LILAIVSAFELNYLQLKKASVLGPSSPAPVPQLFHSSFRLVSCLQRI